MAVLTRDEFFTRIVDITNGDSSETAITFIEDMTDTYNALEERINNGGEDWRARYEENDARWRETYKSRFFNGPKPGVKLEIEIEEDEKDEAEEITVDDLFEEKED